MSRPLRWRELCALLQHPAVQPGDVVINHHRTVVPVEQFLNSFEHNSDDHLDAPLYGLDGWLWKVTLEREDGTVIPLRMSDPLP